MIFGDHENCRIASGRLTFFVSRLHFETAGHVFRLSRCPAQMGSSQPQLSRVRPLNSPKKESCSLRVSGPQPPLPSPPLTENPYEKHGAHREKIQFGSAASHFSPSASVAKIEYRPLIGWNSFLSWEAGQPKLARKIRVIRIRKQSFTFVKFMFFEIPFQAIRTTGQAIGCRP